MTKFLHVVEFWSRFRVRSNIFSKPHSLCSYTQDEQPDLQEGALLALHNVAIHQSKNGDMAPYVPPDNIIEKDPKWLDTLCDESFTEYLSTDATTKRGLMFLARTMDIKINSYMSASDMYIALLNEVVERGAYKNFYMSAIDGYHRVTGLIHSLLRSAIDLENGLVIPDTISVKNFLSVQIDVKNRISDKCLQDKMKESYFGYFGHEQLPVMKPFSIKVYYAKKPRLKVETIAKCLMRISRSISESNVLTVTKCPFVTIGNLLTKTIQDMTEEQMTFRAKFDDVNYPTLFSQKIQKVQNTLREVYGDSEDYGLAKKAYNYCDLLDSEVYQRFLCNPLSDETRYDVIRLLERDVSRYDYHVRLSGLHVLQKRIANGTIKRPSKITFPFYPSFYAMSYDVGREFGSGSYLNPYTANNMILGPIIYTILYAAKECKPVDEIINDEKRKKELHYWLRFHNNFSHKGTVLDIHRAYDVVYKIESTKTPQTLADDEVNVLGATHMIVNMFMSVLACATEHTLDKDWVFRKKSLTNASLLLRNTFNRIGTTLAGRKVNNVITMLGEF